MANLPLIVTSLKNTFVSMTLSKEELAKRVGKNIRKHRQLKQMSLNKFALESGMEYSQVSRIERGVINTSLYQIYILSKTLEVPITVFFFEIN